MNILAQNVRRRHLTVGQRAMIAAEIANLSHGSNQYKVDLTGVSSTPVSQTEAAKHLGTTPLAITRISLGEMVELSTFEDI